MISVVHYEGCYLPVSNFLYFHNPQLHSLVVRDQRVLVVVLNVTEEYLWVCSNEPLMGFEIAYIHGGARVNV